MKLRCITIVSRTIIQLLFQEWSKKIFVCKEATENREDCKEICLVDSYSSLTRTKKILVTSLCLIGRFICQKRCCVVLTKNIGDLFDHFSTLPQQLTVMSFIIFPIYHENIVSVILGFCSTQPFGTRCCAIFGEVSYHKIFTYYCISLR